MDSTSLRRFITNLKYVTAVDCCNGCRQRANCRRLHDGYTSSARTVDLTEVGAETHLLETGRFWLLQSTVASPVTDQKGFVLLVI